MSGQAPDAAGRSLAEEARNRVRFEEEALEHADQVYQVARHLSGSKDEAEELMQETYARAFRSWRSYAPGTNMRAWLLRILTNLNIDRGRRKQRQPATSSLEEGDYSLYDRLEEAAGPGSGENEERLLSRLSQSDIVGSLAELPHDFRDVLVLVDLGEFSYQETAQILSIPIGTVMSRLHRARRLLRQSLASSLGGQR
ncbi:MAG TPA: sigma-70 family RNA polymerase sigma factor [Gaiellaceae bacterium]|jgi:RNA polymerase sigma-70 factor, ECF subfamily